jgi:ABC-2 type transport system ATP-binding protein
MSTSPALSVEALSFRYGAKAALSGVSLAVPQGRVSVLLGPNGAGKSTLINLICRMITPLSGRILIKGQDLATARHRALEALGIVFQEPSLDPELSVARNLAYAGALRGMSRALSEERAARELTRIGLWERREEKVHALNGGHRRRVEIARALMHDPAILIADEATNGLDIPTRAAVLAHMRDLASTRGMAVLWATHLIDEVQTSDRLIVLHRGNVRAEGEAEVLRGNAPDIEAVFRALIAEETA